MKTDSELKEDVLSELAWDPLVPNAKVGVSVDAGVVTLLGHLETYAEKVAATRAVERVCGVKAVAVELDVRPLFAHKRTDTEIAAAAERALEWNTTIPPGSVKLVVENGWVSLSGVLDWNFQRRAVERMIRPMQGVVGISDSIQLRSVALPSDVASRVQAALIRQAVRAAHHVSITMDGSTVSLRGTVHSIAERVAIEGAAFSTAGVTAVENHLRVES